MADNPNVNTNNAAVGATNILVAADDIGGVIHQRVKVEFGTDGTATEVSPAAPLPVVQTGTPALPTGAATEATLSTLNGKIPATVAGSQPTTLRNASGTTIGSLALSTGIEGIMTAAGATDFFFSTLNATTVQLAAAATFTGTIESIVSAQAWSIILTSDQPGTLTLLEYIDAGGTRISTSKTILIAANTPFSQSYTANGNYFRLTFQNTGGSATTTLNINVAFGVLPAVTSLGNGPVSLNEVGGTAFALGAKAPSASLPVNLSNDVVVGAAASIAALNIDLLTGIASGWFDASNYHSCAVQIVGSAGITAGAVTFEQTNDTTVASAGNFWLVEEDVALTPATITSATTIAASTTRMFRGVVSSRYVRVRVSTAFATANVQAIGVFSQLPFSRIAHNVHCVAGQNLQMSGAAAHSATTVGNPARIGGRVISTLDTTLVQGDTSDLAISTGQQAITKDFATSENDWQFACATGGIVNTTTGVQVKAAGAASIRNFMTSLTVSADLLGAATELIVYDGTTATVLWRTKLQTAALPTQTFSFPTPLRGNAATLMGVATVTATVTGGVIFSCQGYQSF